MHDPTTTQQFQRFQSLQQYEMGNTRATSNTYPNNFLRLVLKLISIPRCTFDNELPTVWSSNIGRFRLDHRTLPCEELNFASNHYSKISDTLKPLNLNLTRSTTVVDALRSLIKDFIKSKCPHLAAI